MGSSGKGSSSSGLSQTAPSSGGISPFEFASRFGAIAPSAGTSSAPAKAPAPTREASRGDGAAPSAPGQAPTSEAGVNAVGYAMKSMATGDIEGFIDAAKASEALSKGVETGRTMTNKERSSLLDENYGDEDDNDGEFGGGMDGDLGGM